MKIAIRARGLVLDAETFDIAVARIRSGLDRFDKCLRHVLVTFDDVNGPRGGADIACRVDVVLLDGATARGESLDENPLGALAEALGRAARGVVRRKERSRAGARGWRMPAAAAAAAAAARA